MRSSEAASPAVAETFLALSDDTRLGVLGLLGRAPRRSSELAAALGTSRPSMSRHLAVLRKAGLVEEASQEADARVRTYRLRPERLALARIFLEDLEAFWDDQLGSFKAFAEAKHGKKVT